jgi:hypothetical protein
MEDINARGTIHRASPSDGCDSVASLIDVTD